MQFISICSSNFVKQVEKFKSIKEKLNNEDFGFFEVTFIFKNNFWK